MGRQSTKITLILIVIAVSVRLVLYFTFNNVFAYEKTGSVQGFIDYHLIANNVIKTGEFTVTPGLAYAGVAPAYPYLLALLYTIFGQGSLQVVLLNAACDALSIWLLMGIARQIMPQGVIVGTLAALFFAVYPYFVFQSLTVIDTPLFTMVQLAFLYLMVLVAKRPQLDRTTWLLIAGGGVVLGIVALTRPLGVVVGGAVFLWFLVRNWRDAFVRLIPVAVIGVLVLMPWNVRNYQVFHRFINIGTHAGMNFWFGNSQYVIPYFSEGYHTQWATPEQPPEPLSPPEMDTYLMNLGLTYLRENPAKIPELLWVKFAAYWGVGIFPAKNPVSGTVPIVDYQGVPTAETDAQGNLQVTGVPITDPLNAYSEPLFDRIGRVIHTLYFGTLLALGLIGVVLTRQQWRDVSLIWFVQVIMTVMYVIMSGPTTRYRVPTDPLLFLFSAYTVVRVWEALRQRRQLPATNPR
jgi:4-amino-4-deoxy-L-arabinose transferase-like glycosyltransferase